MPVQQKQEEEDSRGEQDLRKENSWSGNRCFPSSTVIQQTPEGQKRSSEQQNFSFLLYFLLLPMSEQYV